MVSKVTSTLVAQMLPCLLLLGKIIRMTLAGLWYVCLMLIDPRIKTCEVFYPFTT